MGFPWPALLRVEHTEFLFYLPQTTQPAWWPHTGLTPVWKHLVWERPELDTGLQMWSQQCWMEGNNHFSCTLATVAQGVTDFTAKRHCWPTLNLGTASSSHFLQRCFQPVSPSYEVISEQQPLTTAHLLFPQFSIIWWECTSRSTALAMGYDDRPFQKPGF